MKKKILIILNDINRAQEHEWFIRFMNASLFDFEFALINCKDSIMDRFLAAENITTWHFDYKGKKDLPALIFALYRRMKKGKYDIIHTHLFESSLAGLIAGFLAGIPKRIMTRHFSDYHHVWFPSTVKYDRLMNFLATHLVAISNNVKNVFINLEHVNSEKIHVIHHGLDMNEYIEGAVSDERIQILRKKYAIPAGTIVVGAISRFTELKGLQYLIPAFVKLRNDFPGAVLLLANASGDYSKQVEKLLEAVPEENIRLILFEPDIAALYKLMTCFVHIPVNLTAEAFGQTYIESLASKIPSVFTMSGIAPEFATDNKNCFIVPYCDEEAVYNKLHYILNHPEETQPVVETGYQNVMEQFDIKFKIKKLEVLYLEL